MNDDWNNEFEIGRCDHCDRTKEEVEPEEDAGPPTNWCFECWSNRKEEV